MHLCQRVMAGRKHREKEVMKSDSEEGLNTEQLKCPTVIGYIQINRSVEIK